MLEVVERKATKMIPSLRNLSYEERLKRLSMFLLKLRKLRGDMIEVFKIIHGIDKVNLGKLFCIYEDRGTRKHSLCLKIRRHVNSNIGLNFFTRKVINYWKHLTDEKTCKLKYRIEFFFTYKKYDFFTSYIRVK